jgi:murein DD-endopeptidase MepM/ murein hydrolase activator NlpD
VLGGHTRDPDFLSANDDSSSDTDDSVADPVVTSSDFAAVPGSEVVASPDTYGIRLGGPGSIFSHLPYKRYCPKGSTAEEGNLKPTCTSMRPHHGRDFTRPGGGTTGAPVLAALGGVVKTGTDATRGNFITVDHDDGSSTVYMHLSSFDKDAGNRAERGDLIGRVGSTGRASGSHLHFEVFPAGAARSNGNQIDPVTWLTSTPDAVFPIGVEPSRVPE